MSKLIPLPSSRLSRPIGPKLYMGSNWEQTFCANCGAAGGFVPERTTAPTKDGFDFEFAWYICNDCAERLPTIDGTYSVPDEVYMQKVKEAFAERDAHGLELLIKEK